MSRTQSSASVCRMSGRRAARSLYTCQALETRVLPPSGTTSRAYSERTSHISEWKDLSVLAEALGRGGLAY